MLDDDIRTLERLASQGDLNAARRLEAMRRRIATKTRWVPKKLRAGMRVEVSFGAGLDSGKRGVLVDPNSSVEARRATTRVGGRYWDFDYKKEVVILGDDGRYFTMFKNYVMEIPRDTPPELRQNSGDNKIRALERELAVQWTPEAARRLALELERRRPVGVAKFAEALTKKAESFQTPMGFATLVSVYPELTFAADVLAQLLWGGFEAWKEHEDFYPFPWAALSTEGRGKLPGRRHYGDQRLAC